MSAPARRAVGLACLAMLALALAAEAQASEWSYLNDEIISFLLRAAMFIFALVAVSLFIAIRRAQRGVPNAWFYLLVPVETIGMTLVILALTGIRQGGWHGGWAWGWVPFVAWALAHFLHREAKPNPQRHGRRRH